MSELREALDDAWEGEDDGEPLAPASEVLEGTDVSELQEDTGSEAEAESGPRDEAERGFPSEEAREASSGASGAAEGGKSGDASAEQGAMPAPIGWSPEAREGWAGIPEATKKQIVQRERDIEKNMANTGLARQESQVFNQLAGKYQAVMAAEGVNNPFKAVEGMFQTAARLRMGSPQAKAQQIAHMIKNYGVDIETLDSLLVGEAPRANPGQQVQQMIDRRMQPVNQMMNQLAGMQQNKVQEQHNGANQQIGEFAKNAEFINDVRYDMADLMDLATKRGQNLSLQAAYDKACAVHPQISAVLQKRQQQESLVGKRGAALSINGNGHEAPSDTSKNTLGQDVRAAWDAYR
jgi:hypothetical protein